MSSLHSKAINSIKSRETRTDSSVSGDLTINFHPDRLTKDGTPLLSAIARDGVIKSQFETGTSNGGLTAFVGGERYAWEQRVFDGIYDESLAHQRPKYGGFNYLNQPFGASPRFGSSYFILNSEVTERTTYCYPDSFFLPEDFASHDGLKHLISLAKSDSKDLLDNYIEAQFHGELQVKRDIQALVLDPIYKGSDIEKHARSLAIEVRFHSGFLLEMAALDVHLDYRGEEFVNLAREISDKGIIHPLLLSKAIYESSCDEQDIKKVWHYLARFGYQG